MRPVRWPPPRADSAGAGHARMGSEGHGSSGAGACCRKYKPAAPPGCLRQTTRRRRPQFRSECCSETRLATEPHHQPRAHQRFASSSHAAPPQGRRLHLNDRSSCLRAGQSSQRRRERPRPLHPSRIAKNSAKRSATQHKLAQRLRTIALGLIEVCDLGAAGLTPMRPPLLAEEHVNDLIPDQQYADRLGQKSDPDRAVTAST
jgi:hypothetical protein